MTWTKLDHRSDNFDRIYGPDRRQGDYCDMSDIEEQNILLFTQARKHGLKPDQVFEILERQGYRCPPCRLKAIDVKLVVDHDHRHCPGATGCSECVRGFLCSSCNATLGKWGDQADGPARALAYFRRDSEGMTVVTEQNLSGFTP